MFCAEFRNLDSDLSLSINSESSRESSSIRKTSLFTLIVDLLLEDRFPEDRCTERSFLFFDGANVDETEYVLGTPASDRRESDVMCVELDDFTLSNGV